MKEKNIEYLRYNERSAKEMFELNKVLEKDGHESMDYLIQEPFLYYEKLITTHVNLNTKVLDLCCGNGKHSLTAARTGAEIVATDIAENSVELARLRAEKVGLSNISFLVADAQSLPFENDSFEVVTCLGSLSYLDLKKFISEVLRVLKPNGVFICLDSFDHNPVYRLNRFIHYLRGNRSFSTLQRMPNIKTLRFIESKFQTVEAAYFGIFSFLGGVLSKLIGKKKTRVLLDNWDKKCSVLKKHAFKVVFIAKNNIKEPKTFKKII